MQILMDPDAKKMLEREAKNRSVSVGQIIREAVELYEKLKADQEVELSDQDPIWDLVGIARSTDHDLAEQHDHYLYGTSKRRQKQ